MPSQMGITGRVRVKTLIVATLSCLPNSMIRVLHVWAVSDLLACVCLRASSSWWMVMSPLIGRQLCDLVTVRYGLESTSVQVCTKSNILGTVRLSISPSPLETKSLVVLPRSPSLDYSRGQSEVLHTTGILVSVTSWK
ncbi:hypothetical protein AG1IA_02925 [Rhizoctonia solani AG-1 IA]|uniref:Uncharacterized protein n=1 Tax=Thanatephorus cucumeris (strain AG1-IA) TaxID=983506 RepID=L8X1S1_THACA|nr:hypothetical protein AG1IA_02925 [Rhizoctonia solani AG-1 IA]